MSTAALTSLAILKVNWDRMGRDYIENFVPFVAEALRQTTEDVVSLPALQESLRHHFHLDLPLNPLRQILQRAARQDYVRRQSGVFYCNRERLNELNFAAVRNEVVSIHERILSRLREFVRSERGTEWTEDQAASAVHSFLAEHSLKLLYAQAERTPIDLQGLPRDAVYLVASFLSRCWTLDTQLFNDFTVLVKGHLLANAIYLPDAGKVRQRFHDTKVFLDTSVVVFAAGYAGPERQAPCEELLRLLRDFGADLRCFQATLDEVRGILDACAARLRTGHLKDAYGPSIEWFIESGRSASDVELMAARLPQKVRSLGITTDDPPPRRREFQVDEKGFEAALEKAIGYRNPRARVHDVDCVSAMSQIRGDRHCFEVESCRAIFVTSNFTLASTARHFFQADAPEGSAALCITDSSLGNLLWLKNPTKAPDLPARLLIADAFAAIQPPDGLWKMYLAEIARLEESGKVSADEYFALRHTLVAKRALMDLTSGDPSAFTEGTVTEVLKVAKESLRADLQNELSLERRRRESAESTSSQFEARETARRERITTRADVLAKWISRAAYGLLLLLLTGGAVLTFPWSLPQAKEAWYRYLTAAVLVVFFVYTLASMVRDSSRVIRPLQGRLAKVIYRWLSRVSE